MRIPCPVIRMLAVKPRPGHAIGVFCLAAAFIFAVPVTVVGQAVGDLGVSPTRVVLEGRTRTAEISLLNRGTVPATYRISVVNMRMTETGKFETIEEPDAGQNFADELIRYAPRQITLQPGATQTVRLMLRKPKDLEPAEYRSHLYFRAVPPPSAGRSVEDAESGDGIQINLTVVPGVTIPVIVRHGELAASASLSEISLLDRDDGARAKVSFRIKRTGNRSLFGDVIASYIPTGGSTEHIVAQANKLAVYAPNPSRVLVLPLYLPEGVSLTGGRLRIIYRARPEEGGQVIAEGGLDLP